MKMFLQGAVFLAVGVFLSGCAMGGGERWLSAQKEDVDVQGINYRVNWVAVSDQSYDFRTHRSDFGSMIVIMPDPVIEKANSIQATAIVARKLCQSEKIIQELNVKAGDMFRFRYRCT
jgi:hypothetical protein